ncbi:hypothetical protein [Bradyrhizobium sp. USDA 4353]
MQRDEAPMHVASTPSISLMCQIRTVLFDFLGIGRKRLFSKALAGK